MFSVFKKKLNTIVIFWRWEHFYFWEVFKQRVILREVTKEILQNISQVLDNLELLRGVVKCAIICNSFFRDELHNKRVGGVSNSYHKKGMAVDISIKGVDVKFLYEIAHVAKRWFNGIIVYEDRLFIHLDIRPKAKIYYAKNIRGKFYPTEL